MISDVAKVYFNPTLVQLESMTDELLSTQQINFNPTLVQLESRRFAEMQGGGLYFNPTLVQLELITTPSFGAS